MAVRASAAQLAFPAFPCCNNGFRRAARYRRKSTGSGHGTSLSHPRTVKWLTLRGLQQTVLGRSRPNGRLDLPQSVDLSSQQDDALRSHMAEPRECASTPVPRSCLSVSQLKVFSASVVPWRSPNQFNVRAAACPCRLRGEPKPAPHRQEQPAPTRCGPSPGTVFLPSSSITPIRIAAMPTRCMKCASH